MKTFLVDIDSVVADNVPEILRRYNMDYDDKLSPNDITDYDMANFAKCGVEIYEYFWHLDLYDQVYPIDGAQSGVEWLRRMGHKVVFVTSGVHPGKVEWLYRYGFLGNIQNWRQSEDVVIAHDKNLIRGDYLIDDHIKNCARFTVGKSFLFDQPWNRGDFELYRVHGWPDIIEWVSKR